MPHLRHRIAVHCQRIGLASLCLWVLLGLVHTVMSFIRKGFPPNRPPLVGIELGPAARDAALLHELVATLDQGGVLILLPAEADTGEVIFHRYQLAYIDYPLRVFARRVRRPIVDEVAGESAVISPARMTLPPGWTEVARRESFVLRVRTAP